MLRCLIYSLLVVLATGAFQNTPNELYARFITPGVTLMPSIGNGYVSTFLQSGEVYIAGLFNGFLDIAPSHRAVVPSPVNYTISIVNDPSYKLVNGGYLFDVEKAIFSQFWAVEKNNTQVAAIEQRWFAHRNHRSLIVHQLIVDNLQNNNVLPLSLNNNAQYTSEDIFLEEVKSTNSQVLLFNGKIKHAEAINGQVVQMALCTSKDLDINVPASLSATYYSLSTFRTDIYGDSQFPTTDAANDWTTYWNMRENLYESHIQAWKSIWDQAGIEIQGTPDILPLQQTTNTSLYWILSSIRDDWPWSLSPGSLASNGYNGHTFWDCETWMYPSIMMLNTPLGKSLLDYRFNHRAGALHKSKTYFPAYNGTMFPWEDAFSGNEVCPIGVGTCRYEQHITGDIAFALRQYWSNTHDVQWLDQIGFPLVYDICVFWASRGKIHSDWTPSSILFNNIASKVKLSGAQYVIDGVIPPDEYHTGVNNSVYTNVVAKLSFEFAALAGSVLGIPTPGEWQIIAQKLAIPFDVTEQIHLEYDGYTNEEIKQADVILLGFPLMYNMTKQVRANDLNFYSAVTDPDGPAMTWAMTAIGYLEIGQYATAQSYFLEGYANAQPPFQVWTETPTGGTVNFITGCGGFLQSLVFGYPSLRLFDDYIQFQNPTLPTNVTSILLRNLDYRGSQLNVQVTSNSISFTLNYAGPVPLGVTVSTTQSLYVRPSLEEMMTYTRATSPLVIGTPVTIRLPLVNETIVLASTTN